MKLAKYLERIREKPTYFSDWQEEITLGTNSRNFLPSQKKPERGALGWDRKECRRYGTLDHFEKPFTVMRFSGRDETKSRWGISGSVRETLRRHETQEKEKRQTTSKWGLSESLLETLYRHETQGVKTRRRTREGSRNHIEKPFAVMRPKGRGRDGEQEKALGITSRNTPPSWDPWKGNQTASRGRLSESHREALHLHEA